MCSPNDTIDLEAFSHTPDKKNKQMDDVGLMLFGNNIVAAVCQLEARAPLVRPVCDGGANESTVIGHQVLYDWTCAAKKSVRRAALLAFVDNGATDEEAHRARLYHNAYADLFEWKYRFDYRENEDKLVEINGWFFRPTVAAKMLAPP